MPSMLSLIKQDLVISIPQTFTIMWLTFAVLGLRPATCWRRIAALTVVNSVLTDLLFSLLSLPVHLLHSIAITSVMLLLLFRDITFGKKLVILLLSYVIGALSDLVTLFLYTSLFGEADNTAIASSLPQYMLCLYPTLLVQWLISRGVGPRSVRRFAGWRAAGDYIRRTGLVYVLICLLLQLLAGALVASSRLLPGKYENVALFDYLFYATVLMCLPTLYFVIRLIDRTRHQSVLATQEHYIEQISGMFTSIRGQRHDYHNHLQVMHAMLQLGKYGELKEYMAEVVKETHEVGDIVHHTIPAVAALLKAKTAVALNLGISFTSDFTGAWNSQSPVKIIDVVKIAGNLIDNAFDEASKLPPGERRVHIAFVSCDRWLELTVANPGPPMSQQTRQRLFEPGFSTKTGSDRGLGLPIIQERVAFYQGALTVTSDAEHGTVFKVKLPQSASEAH